MSLSICLAFARTDVTHGRDGGFGKLLTALSTMPYQGNAAHVVMPMKPPGCSKSKQVFSVVSGRKKMIALAKT